MLSGIKPFGFTMFARQHGETALLDCLERGEQEGLVYHRQGLTGDYDAFADGEALLRFLEGRRKE